MTIETKMTIQLSDVKAIEFECNNCHRVVTLPLAVAKEPPAQCECKGPQWMPYGGSMYSDLSGLMHLIGKFGNIDNEPFTMRFIVAGPSGHASNAKD